ncbi:5-oxoprolinase subunit PxpB [Aestuariirhabdus sp. Z084]|uniref:5-oxoprolinase subunit PxpB n=1 Tax=Aestuariirhabdus haliotis TaxID=2918751 RepID=UPI00201B3B80|nr:5-oxoprolinase subunit PxpB [Aestuariirhabdus haliotis]MCL6417501.1 5-oxoprolinase subunit PxpB [Aestuariirhabdus haliotis]MCL6421455.1 5-oxoprolinase subunit PxpB [Aestuariirhabdus haliotis]
MRIEVAGENALMLYFGEQASATIAAQVQQAEIRLRAQLGTVLIDLIPSYASLLVIYDPLQTDHFAVKAAMRTLLEGVDAKAAEEGRLVTLPVYYAEESGPDLTLLANNAGLSVDEVIALHQQQEYRVYAIGFAPGFAYLGEVDPRIAAPRLATPRQRVPRGAVAIADRQTAVYPAVSPGGWNLIGLCPQRMFDPEATPSMPVAVGDRVRFEAISRARFFELGGELGESL